jgi:hypothetical protein
MPRSIAPMDKVEWSGRIVAVLPRILLTRSFDQRSHSYLGYVLHVDGTCYFGLLPKSVELRLDSMTLYAP